MPTRREGFEAGPVDALITTENTDLDYVSSGALGVEDYSVFSTEHVRAGTYSAGGPAVQLSQLAMRGTGVGSMWTWLATAAPVDDPAVFITTIGHYAAQWGPITPLDVGEDAADVFFPFAGFLFYNDPVNDTFGYGEPGLYHVHFGDSGDEQVQTLALPLASAVERWLRIECSWDGTTITAAIYDDAGDLVYEGPPTTIPSALLEQLPGNALDSMAWGGSTSTAGYGAYTEDGIERVSYSTTGGWIDELSLTTPDLGRPTRLYPRDDGRGLSSAPRRYPTPRSTRLVGGHQ